MRTCLPVSFSDPHFSAIASRGPFVLLPERSVVPPDAGSQFTDNRIVLVGKKNLEVRPTAINKVGGVSQRVSFDPHRPATTG